MYIQWVGEVDLHIAKQAATEVVARALQERIRLAAILSQVGTDDNAGMVIDIESVLKLEVITLFTKIIDELGAQRLGRGRHECSRICKIGSHGCIKVAIVRFIEIMKKRGEVHGRKRGRTVVDAIEAVIRKLQATGEAGFCTGIL